MTPLHVGMRVICVNDEIPAFRTIGKYFDDLDGLTRSRIYTIRELCQSSDVDNPSLPCCRLEEIKRRFDPLSKVEAAFALARFRPAHENRMDELRTLLAPVPSKERELVQS